MTSLAAIKLGGSVITSKTEYRSFRSETTASIVKALSEKFDSFALVIGGGSFGHFKSKEFGLPGKASKRTMEGAGIVHRDMSELAGLVHDSLMKRGLNAYSFSPGELMRGGIPDYAEPLRYLEAGMIPLLYGDVFASGGEFMIYSGDSIMLDLCKTGRFDKAIFFSDVDGIFDRDPKRFKDAKLMKRLSGKIDFSTSSGDVTGGMRLKHSSMLEIAKHVKEVYLINGNYPERIGDIGSEDFIGTVID